MKTAHKIYLGIVTLWPSLYWLAVLIVKEESEAISSFLIVVNIPTILLTLSMMIFYIVNIFKNELVPQNKKVTWAILLFLFGLVLMPVYWYFYIWPTDDMSPSRET